MEKILVYTNQALQFIENNWSYYMRLNYYYFVTNNLTAIKKTLEKIDRETDTINKLNLLNSVIRELESAYENISTVITIFLSDEERLPVQDLIFQALEQAKKVQKEFYAITKQEIPDYVFKSKLEFPVVDIFIAVLIIGVLYYFYRETQTNERSFSLIRQGA